MQFTFSELIEQELINKGIIIDSRTIRPYLHQGWMSQVFIADSNVGHLIIHSADLVNEHRRNKVWEKFTGLTSILASHNEIPTTNFCYVGMQAGKLILVQKYINGLPCGKRVLEQKIISDQWSYNRTEIFDKLVNILTKIHKVKLSGFGWPSLYNNELIGKYETWQEFLVTESAHWVEVVNQIDQKLGNTPIENLEKDINSIIGQINYSGPAVLVHGDAINPSNILLNDNKEVSLIDWEWSIAADPAWEFCDLGWWPFIDRKNLSLYFKVSGISNEKEIEDFLRRIKLYIPLWLLWGAHMHAEDTTAEVYQSLRPLLILKL